MEKIQVYISLRCNGDKRRCKTTMNWFKKLIANMFSSGTVVFKKHLKGLLGENSYGLLKEKISPYIKQVNQEGTKLNEKWVTVQNSIRTATKIVDLGCGNNPVQGAAVGVDRYIAPGERSLGKGDYIEIDKMKERGVLFTIARIDDSLPFKNHEFDFAYSHHVFEHLDNPGKACSEMMRIAKSGVIITPSIFSELIFGRPYHKWLVMNRGDTIFFFKKREFEDRPFGEHPEWQNGKGWIVTDQTNPFDILLNEGNWYHSGEKCDRLSNILRRHWYTHSSLIEVVFLWKERFNYIIYD